ncbi:MAG: 50S ribosomal protein L5 [Candidatus Aenigmarchaeota archaeon]|nr:50S ribosomal protein L5 [Candidatus Aenigmarchaeota archaeon]
MSENPMKQIRIEKVTLNIGCGDDKQKIENARKFLEKLTQVKPVITVSKTRSTFGIAKGKPLGVKVTLRNGGAEQFFNSVLKSFDNKVKQDQIDNSGNLSFGVKEYIDLPNVKYMPEIGMLGMDVAVTLERPGYHVKRRRIKKAIIGKTHRINKEDITNWLQQRGVKVE